MSDQKIQLVIEAVNKADAEFARLKAQLKGVNDQVASTNASAHSAGASIRQLQAGWFALAGTAGALVMVAKQAVQAYVELEAAQMKLAVAMRNQGDFTRENFAALKEYAAQLQKVTTYDDDLTIAMMATLKSYGMNTTELKAATVAAMDLATAKGMNLATAAELVGKAFVGETRTLARYGIIIGDGVKKSEKFDAVLRQIQQRFGGSAQAEIETYGGQWKQIANWWGDIAEKTGLALLKTLEAVQFAVGMVGVGFYSVLEKITQGWRMLFEQVERLPVLGKYFAGFVDHLRTIEQGWRGAKDGALGFADQNYKMLGSFNRVEDAVMKMGRADETAKKTGTQAAGEYNLTQSALNGSLDRMADILNSAKDGVSEFGAEIRKLTATAHEAKLIDIDETYRKDMEAIEKYKTDMDRAVRELQEKIAKARADAAKKNAKRDVGGPVVAVDPALQADLDNMLKAQEEAHEQVEIMRKQAAEKRRIAVDQENSGSLASVRSFVAAQTQEYTQLTGNIRAGYKAEADALRAKLAEELADVKKSAEEKAAITLLYNEKIRQAEVVKPAEYDRAAREAEINNHLASLDLIEAEGTAHRNTINERIRLTEELISLQRQSLAAMPKTGNEQAWNAQMDKIIAEQKKRAELVREQLMNSPIEAMKLGFKDLLNKWTDVGQQMYDVSQTTATAMRDAFSDIFFDAFQGKLKSVGDYITSFVNSVNRAIANYLANMAAAGLIGAVKSGISSFFNLGASGSSSMGSSTSTISGNSTGTYFTVDQSLALGSHGGGIAGREAPTFYRMVPNLAFAGAPRFHGGFAPDEYPAVLQRGEGVFTPGQMRALGLMAAGSGGDSQPNVEVNIINQSGTELSGKQRGSPKFDGRKWVLDIVVEGMERYAPLRTAVGNMRV
jgi:hypothetical protein